MAYQVFDQRVDKNLLLNLRDSVEDTINLFDTMEWKEGPTLPVGMKNAQAVIFENKLYVGGGPTRSLAGKGDHDAYLFIYDYADPGCATKKWTKMNTPVSRFGIAVYRSQLILVGGQMKDSANFTNRLWTMACTQWAEELPSMEFRRCHPCCVAHERCILVVGGEAEVDSPVQSVDIVVELYNGEQWTSIQPLPNEAEDICLCMKSVVIDRNVYLMGGEGRDETVYVAHLDSIINSTPDQESPWKALPNIPDSSAPMVLGNLLIAVGGSLKPSGEIHVYSPGANSWKTTEEVLPKPVRDTCATILPTGELMVIGGLVKRGVYTDAVFIGTPKEDVYEAYRTLRYLRVALQENMKLKSENGEIKLENEKLKSEKGEIKLENENLKSENGEMKYENEKLKDEIKQLKEQLSALEKKSPSNGSHDQRTELTHDHHKSLLEQLSRCAAKWREIGTKLGFKQGELDNIECIPAHSVSTNAPNRNLCEMLTQWLEWAPGDARGSEDIATLEGLKRALFKLNLGRTAEKLHL